MYIYIYIYTYKKPYILGYRLMSCFGFQDLNWAGVYFEGLKSFPNVEEELVHCRLYGVYTEWRVDMTTQKEA